jgi:hypothetical protein
MSGAADDFSYGVLFFLNGRSLNWISHIVFVVQTTLVFTAGRLNFGMLYMQLLVIAARRGYGT